MMWDSIEDWLAEEPAEVVDTDNRGGSQVRGVDTPALEGTAAGTGGSLRKREVPAPAGDCNHNRAVHKECSPAADTWGSCTVGEVAVVVVVVAAPGSRSCHNDRVVADNRQGGILGMGGEDKDCNYNNYCNRNRRVECYQFFRLRRLADLNVDEAWQWALGASLGRHPTGNRVKNPRFPRQIDHQVCLHPGRHQLGCPACPNEKK